MKITDAKMLVSSPGRNFVTLNVFTDQGIYGLGDATLNGRTGRSLLPLGPSHPLPGRPRSFQTEDIGQYFYRGAYWRRGPVTMTAIAAIDMALWDIKGKALNTPDYSLLGGRSRGAVLVYGHVNGRNIEETEDDVARYMSLGYKAVRAQTGIPASHPPTAWQKTRCTMSRPKRGCPRKTPGPQRNIFFIFQSCSNRFVSSSAMKSISTTI